jgi:hypothetical protein
MHFLKNENIIKIKFIINLKDVDKITENRLNFINTLENLGMTNFLKLCKYV